MSHLSDTTTGSGEFFLVSAGIGDADNITVKALTILSRANLILAMPFVQQQLADYLPEGATVLDAGHGLFNADARHFADLEQIQAQETSIRQQIRQAFADGQCIVLLEFGDPTLFGPQTGYLTEFSDLNPVIIPGISSFNAANAGLGQPLLRHQHQQLMMSSSQGIRQHNWQPPDVLVLFTMQTDIPELAEQLSLHYAPETPVALVFHAGYMQRQQVIRMKLSDFQSTTATLDIPWEYLIYVGAQDVL